MNTITINFIPCNPAPANGYKLMWRVAGSGDPYTDAGFYTESPIYLVDEINPEGTCYEGYLQSDCSESGESGTLVGNAIPWATICEDSGATGDYTIEMMGVCSSSESNFKISGGTPGDTVKVRAYYSGNLQKVPEGFQTKAVVSIFSTGGTYDIISSSCYADEFPHSFNLTVDTILTMPDVEATVTTIAEVFRSADTYNFLQVAIIEINGNPVYIFTNGCDSSTDTDPSC